VRYKQSLSYKADAPSVILHERSEEGSGQALNDSMSSSFGGVARPDSFAIAQNDRIKAWASG